ncbi:MAG: hypothetical protein JWQ75_2859 [Pseudarthrobacter sp.]|nr:hypothetical protein [Pseudarthrobacter sp.]
MITLQQDAEGFIRMKRHFPAAAEVSVTFADGSNEVFSGSRLNEIYDDALAAYRAANQLDAKGFSRGPQKKIQTSIEFVPVSPGMAQAKGPLTGRNKPQSQDKPQGL